MNITLQHQVHARTDNHRVVQRRDFLRTLAATSLGSSALSWTDAIRLSAGELRDRGMACILLWMNGGPSQLETWDPKPGHENGGETKAIATSVPGIHVADNLPKLGHVVNDIAIIRSMTSKEGSHPRATFLMHHGYLPMGGVKFPTLGSNVAHQIGDPSLELPSHVRIGGRARDAGGAGFLGVEFDPLILTGAKRPPDNTQLRTAAPRHQRRLALLEKLETDFAEVEAGDVVADHHKLLRRASTMILSKQMDAFDIEREAAPVRQSYGDSQFGTGCLLARRLVESGVTFVEVVSGGWDTHLDNFERTRELTAQIDRPLAQLITDLRERRMLDRTLIVWMGEFGRTPRINPRAGRDHYPKAFSVALAGGGVRGGQVIGATDDAGTEVTDRPVTVPDLFRSVYHALGINADQENISRIGRPIKLVDGGQVVGELFG